ncbi:TetR/AcrR family transcriptional regulator [Flavicella sp.]|uniref:TetR/AcrR family transcriptional regulator n=1 Tax=Flavicella sp. TaxID=2957742 RepID=UPI00301A3EC9
MKKKILETASEMFLNYGFKSVTMDDIAEKMHVSKKTIYTHYSNKNKLIEETTLELYEYVSSGINFICKKKNNSIEEFFQIKTFILENIKFEKSSTVYQLQKYYPKIHENLICKHFDVIKDYLTNNLLRGIDDGLYREEIDVEFITRIYFNGLNGINDSKRFSLDTFNQDYLLKTYLDYHVRGIATEKGLQTLKKVQNQYN